MLTVAIQAGGESRRMGQDKALLPFLGQPLITRVLYRVAPLADEVIVTTNRPTDYQFLGVPLYTDLLPGRGALGGLYTALAVSQHPIVAVVACDMPFVNANLLKVGKYRLSETTADVVIPRTDQGYEPFHAVYRRETCLKAVKAALDAGEWRLISWLPDVQVVSFSPEEISRYDPQSLAFWNLNTPEEFQQAERIAVKSDQ